MKDKFISYYQNNNLFTEEDRILLTVSGGIDSMAMVNLFQENNLRVGIAHCNFQLRGNDSELDEQFVRDFANRNEIPFYTKRFNTEEFANEKGISIQMAARELRYNWFYNVCRKNGYQYLATAHHKNDVAETMLINIAKGTGLSGLHGIKNKNRNIVRPLLCFSRKEILDYVQDCELLYREDLSNTNVKYTRNAIRHQVIPELEKLNPSIIETLNEEANRFKDIEEILIDKVNLEKKNCFEHCDGQQKIKIDQLIKLSPLKTYLYYFLKDYGFNFSTVVDIAAGLKKLSGKTFYSNTHVLVKDRDYLILKETEVKENHDEIEIKSIEELPFEKKQINIPSDFTFNPSSVYAYLDVDKITFPLMLRNWKPGDTFQPLGMKGKKKISDFLVDLKLSILDKEKVKVLESAGQIVWLIGYRIDDRFKLTPSSKKVLILSLKEEY